MRLLQISDAAIVQELILFHSINRSSLRNPQTSDRSGSEAAFFMTGMIRGDASITMAFMVPIY